MHLIFSLLTSGISYCMVAVYGHMHACVRIRPKIHRNLWKFTEIYKFMAKPSSNNLIANDARAS